MNPIIYDQLPTALKVIINTEFYRLREKQDYFDWINNYLFPQWTRLFISRFFPSIIKTKQVMTEYSADIRKFPSYATITNKPVPPQSKDTRDTNHIVFRSLIDFVGKPPYTKFPPCTPPYTISRILQTYKGPVSSNLISLPKSVSFLYQGNHASTCAWYQHAIILPVEVLCPIFPRESFIEDSLIPPKDFKLFPNQIKIQLPLSYIAYVNASLNANNHLRHSYRFLYKPVIDEFNKLTKQYPHILYGTPHQAAKLLNSYMPYKYEAFKATAYLNIINEHSKVNFLSLLDDILPSSLFDIDHPSYSHMPHRVNCKLVDKSPIPLDRFNNLVNFDMNNF